MTITIKSISARCDLKKFIHFGIDHYQGNDFFVPPLIQDELNTFDASKNPALAFCDCQHFLAYQGEQIVGRIAGIINRRSNEFNQEKKARFGWIEFTDNPKVSQALLQAVENWAQAKGIEEITGPMGFTDLDYEGCLIQGFDQLGTMATIYNHPYYAAHLESLGYTQHAEWVEYKIIIPKETPDRYRRFSEIVQKKHNLQIVKPNSRRKLLNCYGKQIFEIINQAYSPLYGFTALNPDQIDYYIKNYLPMLRLDCVRIVTNSQEQVIGFGITIPSLSKALQKAKGKLFPFGWYHLLRALRSKNEIIDMYLIAVLPEYQNKGVNAMIFHALTDQYIENGYVFGETNPELVDNHKMRSQWDLYEHEQHKRRVAFTKKLTPEVN